MASETVLVVGCGNMGFAMVKGWLDAGVIRPGQLLVAEPSEALRERAAELGTRVAPDATAFAGETVALAMIAVKPQMLDAVLPGLKAFADTGTQFFTVAAGAPLSLYARHLGATAGVIRTMPNTPAAVGAGMIAYVTNRHVSAPVEMLATRLLEANGRVAKLDDESLMDAVTAVSGSGPAYLFHFIECLSDAARAAGLPDDLAVTFARQTVFGAARLAEQASEDAAQLRRNVTSPKGTTAAALDILMADDGLKPLLTRAVDAAKRRSIELGQ